MTNPQLHAGIQGHCTIQNQLLSTSQKIAVGVTWVHLGPRRIRKDESGKTSIEIFLTLYQGFAWDCFFSEEVYIMQEGRTGQFINPSCTSWQPHTAPTVSCIVLGKLISHNVPYKDQQKVYGDFVKASAPVFLLTLFLQITKNFLWRMSLTEYLLCRVLISLQEKVISSQ